MQEALPELGPTSSATFSGQVSAVAPETIIASTSSTISPKHMADAVRGPERFLVAHWLNPAHIIPLVDVVPGPRTAPEHGHRAHPDAAREARQGPGALRETRPDSSGRGCRRC